MILTYKVKHNTDFSDELRKAKRVAQHALKTKSRTSADVTDIGLKSMIANQILKKYSGNKKIKRVKRVNLIVPSQGIKCNQVAREIYIPSLNLRFNYQFPNDFVKINQIEINKEYCFVSVTKLELGQLNTDGFIGVDLNTTSHVAVVANPSTGTVKKLGKKCYHIHKKYSCIRKHLQRNGKFVKLARVKNRESRIVRDTNHKVSRAIVDYAKRVNKAISLEDLTGIRRNKKQRKSFKYALHSWSFYQLRQFIVYKAKLLGVPVVFIPPQYTSKNCSRCGQVGNRQGKTFKCPLCGHVDHADANAAFNIAAKPWLIASKTEIGATGTLMSPKRRCA